MQMSRSFLLLNTSKTIIWSVPQPHLPPPPSPYRTHYTQGTVCPTLGKLLQVPMRIAHLFFWAVLYSVHYARHICHLFRGFLSRGCHYSLLVAVVPDIYSSFIDLRVVITEVVDSAFFSACILWSLRVFCTLFCSNVWKAIVFPLFVYVF